MEGNPTGTLITRASWKVQLWALEEVAAVQLLIPYFISMFTGAIYDQSQTVSDPGDWIVTTCQNLFLRDYGHIEGGSANLQTPSYPGVRPRVVHRDFGLIQCGAAAYAGNQWGPYIHRFRTGRIPLRNDQALCCGIGAYNTHQTEDISLGYCVSGTFGYIHRSKDA